MKINTKKISFVEPLTLQSGEVLHGFDLMTETYGELSDAKDNAVLVCHAFLEIIMQQAKKMERKSQVGGMN